MLDVAILGAGISGLTAAWRLRAAGRSVEVFEARDRLGGRAFTRSVAGRAVDLGATWVWDSETHVHGLLDALGVQTVATASAGLDLYDDGALQRGRLPTSAVPERRIAGGMAALVHALAERAGPVHLGQPVVRLEAVAGGVAVHTERATVHARAVLAALPPSLVAALCPDLPEFLRQVPVWMGEIAKCVGLYDRPIWTEAGLSGRAFSRLGPMSEVHDLSTAAGPALFGFAARADAADLETRVPAQLARLFGAPPREVVIQRWWDERFTTASGEENERLFGHRLLREPFLDGRLHLISCETSGVSPGHLDGAVERAEAVCRDLAARPSTN
jgi:monoamine oxidase